MMLTPTITIHFNYAKLLPLAQHLLSFLIIISHGIESIMFRMVQWYDIYMYTPLQVHLSPYMARIPRCITIGKHSVTIFNANIVTYSRTFLIIPIAWCLKLNYPMIACLLVILHDFLDHIDGIVAKVQKRIYGENIDDPLLGGFMDAFCDKIVNIFCLWTIIQETHFEQTSIFISIGFIILCYTIIALETAIGIIRVQDYFYASFNKNKTSSQCLTSAGMEGKLKEKLESIGLAFLCISTGHLSPFDHWSGIIGMICFSLTIRLAFASLIQKLQARETKERKKTVTIDASSSSIQKTSEVVIAFNSSNANKSRNRAMTMDSVISENEKQKQLTPSSSISSVTNDIKEDEDDRSSSTSSSEDESSHVYQRSASLPAIYIDGRADKVYTVGCFDLFHEGHKLLLQRMRQFGREVIVGVHCSRSIHKLKKRVPVEGTETRMLNVKRYADQVYCVAGTDPSAFVTSIVHIKENETAVYVRGDDMGDFPSRHVVEALMPVKFLPYTNGVSSTKLRQELFSHIKADDMEHLDNIN